MWRAVILALVATLIAGPVAAKIVQAEYREPTDRYDHGVLGDSLEWSVLRLTESDGDHVVIRLPKNRVFEDLNPRIIHDATGASYAMVVETDLVLGARLALYDGRGLVDATPFLGQKYRWLAPVGAADLDGDGVVEIAYVEKPHLTKILKVWRLKARKLTFVASLGGLSNHRIGEDFISGGIRNCGQGPEIITANSSWSRIMATRLRDGKLRSRVVGVYRDPTSFEPIMACR